jgi:uncharacterized protein YkwD
MSRLVATLALLACACSSELDGGGTTGDLDFCVAETNRLRALDGRPALAHSPALEEFATDAARIDTEMGSAHYHFASTSGGGIAFAENECPSFLGWRLMGDVQSTIAACLEAFYDEGPGGGHYENLMGNYASVGCGVYLQGDAITIVQDFGH